ncbi:hypothetical protein IGI37_003214 [Enterococcus sp. AZ194]|uniref:hypothetical protein n=1 Tax=Enterococcus sp. AZ194 TaxID=2774629 RepID=UPI003F24AA74
MTGLEMGYGLFFLSGLFIFLSRLIIIFRINQLESTMLTKQFRKKLDYYKKKVEKTNQFLILGYGSVGLLLAGKLFLHVNQLTQQTNQIRVSVGQVTKDLKEWQTFLKQPATLVSYPQKGLELASYYPGESWRSRGLVLKEKDQFEKALKEKLTPYFGEVQPVYSVGESGQGLALHLMSEVADSAEDLLMLGKNLSYFLEDATQVNGLFEIQIRVTTTGGQSLYKGSYRRATNEEAFVYQEYSQEGKG